MDPSGRRMIGLAGSAVCGLTRVSGAAGLDCDHGARSASPLPRLQRDAMTSLREPPPAMRSMMNGMVKICTKLIARAGCNFD